jgi:translation elongation factor EF-1beta
MKMEYLKTIMATKTNKVRLITFAIFITVIFVYYSVHIYFLVAGQDNTDRTNLWIISRDSVQLNKLNDHVKKLEGVTVDINNYTFNELKDLINESVTLIRNTNTEIIAQQKSWSEIRSRIAEDKVNFEQLKSDLNQIENIQSKEIERLQRAINDANETNYFRIVIDNITSFILGLVSSLFASFILPHLLRKKDNI